MAKANRPAVAGKPTSSTVAASQHPVGPERPLPVWITGLSLTAVLVLTFILYLPSLKNGFTNLDDDVYVTNNTDLVWSGKNLRTLATKEVAGNFHPLTMWSLSLDRGTDARKTPDPAPFHRSNLFLHLLNTALVFGLMRRLHSSVWVAALVALFFGIHPLHVESVAWVSGRKDVLYTAFFLSGLITYTFARRGVTGSSHPGWWFLTAILFVLSCLSKPAAIVFPVVVLSIEWYLTSIEHRQVPAARTLLKKQLAWLLPFLGIAAFFAVQTLRYQQHVGAVAVQYGFLKRLLFAAYGIAIYPVKMLFPLGLSAMHPAPGPSEPPGAALMAAPFGALLLLGLTVWAYRRQKDLFWGLVFYLINVALVLGFIKVGSALYAERYTYVAYIGLFYILGWGAGRLWGKGGIARMATTAALALLGVVFALQTSRQIPVWHNSETLWTQVIDRYPTALHFSYRGYYYYTAQQYDKALSDFNRADKLKPGDETTTHIRALCLEKSGRPEDAWKVYAAYEQQFPPNKDELFHAGNCLMSLRRYQEAIERYTKVVQLDPRHIDALNNRANAWFELKQYAQAEKAFSETLAVNPKFLSGLNNRGAARLSLGKWQDAIADFTQSLSIDPAQGQIFRYRSMALERLGRAQEAAVDKAEAQKRGR